MFNLHTGLNSLLLWDKDPVVKVHSESDFFQGILNQPWPKWPPFPKLYKFVSGFKTNRKKKCTFFLRWFCLPFCLNQWFSIIYSDVVRKSPQQSGIRPQDKVLPSHLDTVQITAMKRISLNLDFYIFGVVVSSYFGVVASVQTFQTKLWNFEIRI